MTKTCRTCGDEFARPKDYSAAQWARRQFCKMTITKADLAQTASGRAQAGSGAVIPCVEGWQGGALTVWVPGRPSNPLNGSHMHWSKRSRWAKGWREKTAAQILNHVFRSIKEPQWKGVRTETPKRVTFTVHGPSRFDDDNLRAVVKPCRDALKDMRVIDDDRDSSGHDFRYAQAKPTRKPGAVYGIAITIELRKD